MLTKQSAIETAKLFLKDLRNAGYNPSDAWLFGSVINGNIHSYSDIDLAVWDKSFTGILHQDYEKIALILIKYSSLELHSFSENETENENPFIEVIKKNGEQIPVS